MALPLDNSPSFLQRARKVEFPDQSGSQPSFLKRAKKAPKYDESKFQTEEETEREIDRAKARTLSRGAETVLGAPGDIASFISGLFGKEQNILPTSQSLRGLSEKASLGYTKPKTEFEEKGDELVSDIASMAMPGSGHYSFARNIGIPVVGTLVKEGLKYSGKDEKNQAYGKVGTMIALDLLSRRSGGVKKYASSLFDKADELIPKGVSIQATGLEKSLTALEKELAKGGKRSTATKSLEKIVEIKNEIKNGKINAQSLAAYRPSINEAIIDLGGFSPEISRKLAPKAIFNLTQVKKEVIKTLSEYGKKFNPEFWKASQAANEAWGAYENSNKIAKFIHSKIPFTPKSKGVQMLFDYAPGTAILAGATKLSPLAGAATAASIAGYQGYKVLHRVIKSPVLRRYYGNVLKEAAVGNASATAKNLKALDYLLEHSEDQEYKE